MMEPLILTHDAKAILLLCGRFGKKEASDGLKPLSLGEYNRLTDWLQGCHMRPSDLLTEKATALLDKPPTGIEATRIKRLLGRGAAMALAIERWTHIGIWVICRSDAAYPERLKQHLKKQAPPVLYGIGDAGLLNRGGLAVVGSRNVDAKGESYTRIVAEECAKHGIQIVSGGARGVDQIAMIAALESGGTVAAILADSLLKAAVAGKYRDGIRKGRLALLSPFYPDARFTVGNAMSRNKCIYALADYVLVVSADVEKGGTWAGAKEELRRETTRAVFIRQDEDAPEGNRALMKLGALPFPNPPWEGGLISQLQERLLPSIKPMRGQMSLFGDPMIEEPEVATVKEDHGQYPALDNDSAFVQDQALQAENKKPLTNYDAILPVLLHALSDWRKPEDLATELEIREAQLDDWLKRAVDEKIVEKKSRPVRYRRK